MLQPVTIVPSAVSRAAPTLKCEKSAYACSRAARAAAIRSAPFGSRIRDPESRSASDALNDPLEQRDERAANTLHGGNDLVVHDRLRQDSGGGVRDARYAQHLESHVPRRDRFGYGGHADRVGAYLAIKANLRRRFVAGPMHGDVDAMRHGDTFRRRRLVGQVAQTFRINLCHVRKPYAEPI